MTFRPTKFVLLGHPVAHSLSPAMQNAALSAAGITTTYEALDVPPANLRATLANAKSLHWAGNVTVPHKEAAFRFFADRDLTDEAKDVGAVNTFGYHDGRFMGHNTDPFGFGVAIRFLLRLRGETPIPAMTIGLFGAGGAAAAVLSAIAVHFPGSSALVVNRDPKRAAALVARFGSVARVSDATEVGTVAELVVNATSLGIHAGDSGPIDPARLRKDTTVLDLVYKPGATEFVQAARARGLTADDGLPMLVAQGMAAFSWWLDREPDVEAMWRAVGRTPP